MSNTQKIIEEKIKGLREFYVEMHPMHGHDTHNPPLLYNSKSEDVDELFESIRQALNQIRQETLREIEEEIEKIKDTEFPHKTQCSVGESGLVCNCGIDERIKEKNQTINDIINLINLIQAKK